MKKKIIYILGAGRCGTTIIDIVLGNNKDIFSCGELVRYSELKGEPHGFPPQSKNYQFWKKIEKKLFNNLPTSHDELFKLTRKIEFHTSFFFNLFGFISRKDRKKYQEYVNNFFDILFESVDNNIVVDSSKYAGRALGLLRYLHYDIYIIYVFRDPVKVVEAFSKMDVEQPPKGFIAANIYYFLVNFICRIVLMKAIKARTYILKYEDFIINPTRELENIQNSFHIDLGKSIQLIRENKEFKVGYLFEGNRVRLQKKIHVQSKISKPKMNLKTCVTRMINIPWWP